MCYFHKAFPVSLLAKNVRRVVLACWGVGLLLWGSSAALCRPGIVPMAMQYVAHTSCLLSLQSTTVQYTTPTHIKHWKAQENG